MSLDNIITKLDIKEHIEKFKSFLKNIGVLNKIEFDIEEVGQPIPFTWGKCKLATTSYGHGITTTPLQVAKGYSIIANGGYDIKPTLIKKDLKNEKIYHHIGIYAFTIVALTKYVKLSRSKFEISRNLEQMRAMENNFTAKVGLCASTPLGVDTEEDLLKVTREMSEIWSN